MHHAERKPACPGCGARLLEHHAKSCKHWGQVLPSEVPGFIESVVAEMRAKEPPGWLVRAALNNAHAYAYLERGRRDGFTSELFQLMAHALVVANDELTKVAADALARAPAAYCERDPKCVWPMGHDGDTHCHTASPTPPGGVGQISELIESRDRSPASAGAGQQNERNFGGSDGR